MKRAALLIAFCLALLTVTAASKPLLKPMGNVSFFYSSLSPYGDWIQLDFGYAWRPHHISHGWRPYLYGRWAWTDYGWYWVSSEPYGWATYHYGRWQYDDYYGWIWVPDDVWGPAWVEWRYNDDYIGWAPLPPAATFSVGVGITFSHRWAAPLYYWNFVPSRNFTATRVVDYVQPIEHTRRIFGSTRGTVDIRTDGDRVVNRGIDREFVERRGNVRIDRIDVVQHENAGGERIVREANRDRIEMYRPRLDARVAAPAPQRQPNVSPSPRNDRAYRGPQVQWKGRAPMNGERTAVPPPSRYAPQPQPGDQRARVQQRPQWQQRPQVQQQPQGRQFQGNRTPPRVERTTPPSPGRPERNDRPRDRNPRP